MGLYCDPMTMSLPKTLDSQKLLKTFHKLKEAAFFVDNFNDL